MVAQHHIARLAALCSLAVIIVLSSVAVEAGIAEAAERHAAMAIDGNTGAVLFNEDGDEPRYPASLTKMMTLYMAFELIESGRLSYEDRITISQRAADAQPSKLDLDAGETIRVIDAVKALVTKSANDVAIALAEHIGGSEANFARLMTAKARAIGMKRTTFVNASGLPDPNQITTARDMITLGLRLQDDFPQHYRHFATRAFSYGNKTFRNHNTMLASFAGIDGIKTGYTAKSGFNLVTSVRRDGRHVVAAVFGGASAATRNGEMRIVLSNALRKASMTKTRRPTLIAKAQPAKRPERAQDRPQARPDTRLASIAKLKPSIRDGLDEQPEPSPANVSAAGTQPSYRPPVQVFKVRPVSVIAARSEAETQKGEPPHDEIAALVAASETEFRNETHSAAAEDQPEHPRFAFASVASSRTPQPETTSSLQSPASRGSPPSTLQAQAASLYSLPARTGRYEIQIGAYESKTEAERAIGETTRKAGNALTGFAPVTRAVTKDGRQLFRARFSGFDSVAAARTCADLKRQSLQCLAVAE